MNDTTLLLVGHGSRESAGNAEIHAFGACAEIRLKMILKRKRSKCANSYAECAPTSTAGRKSEPLA